MMKVLRVMKTTQIGKVLNAHPPLLIRHRVRTNVESGVAVKIGPVQYALMTTHYQKQNAQCARHQGQEPFPKISMKSEDMAVLNKLKFEDSSSLEK
mmetsp:Transcript_33147/g.50026  ORF Transcript_33147/g.50026 Transcript_33147/m.50026 type:complete len:96 (-) Transcript_33147:197-484(-)